MKVYACPSQVPVPEPDYKDYKKQMAAEEKHTADLAAWFIARGYTGKYTGRVYSQSVGDGAAQYMFVHGPTAAKCFLVHLPYGDGYQALHLEFIPASEFIRGFKRDDACAEEAKKANPDWESVAKRFGTKRLRAK